MLSSMVQIRFLKSLFRLMVVSLDYLIYLFLFHNWISVIQVVLYKLYNTT